MPVKKNASKRIARWKIDLGISNQYLSPFFTFQTLATLLYSTFSFIENAFPGYLIIAYYGLTCLLFLGVFKLCGKFILWVGVYNAEREYERNINPFDVNRASEKDKNYSIPFSVVNASLSIQSAKLLIMWGDKTYGPDSELWKKEKEETMKYIEEVQNARDKYETLRFSK